MVTQVSRLILLSALATAPTRADVLAIGDAGQVTVLAADRPAAAPAKLPAALIDRAARDHGISPQLLEALVWQESRGRVDAVSPKGAIGLTQLMPDTARSLGVNPHDPAANLDGGARYLRQQLDRFGDLELALAAYNAGPERVGAAHGVPAIAETRNYIDAVIARTAQTP